MMILKQSRRLLRNAYQRELLEEIQAELELVEQKLLVTDKMDVPMSWDINRIISSGGKRLRPILAHLCYGIGGKKSFPVQPLMCMLELMHTASLIHDDVVDNAEVRRGCETINASTGKEAAVQSGDYLLAEAMSYLHFYKGTGINEALVQASADMCLGELYQLNTRYQLEMQTRETYFLQIYRKTASLIAASCYSGAIAGGLSELKANMLKIYGEKLGLAFQLADDLLDFAAKPEFGKTTGQDLLNGIFTLPVLFILEESVPESIKSMFMKKNKDTRDVIRLVEFLRESQALDYTRKIIRQLTAEAVKALRDYPESVEKAALTELAVNLSDRKV